MKSCVYYLDAIFYHRHILLNRHILLTRQTTCPSCSQDE